MPSDPRARRTLAATGAGAPDHPGTGGFVFLLEEEFAMLAFTSAVEVLRQANTITGRALYPYSFCTLDGAPVAASNGAALMPNRAIDTLGRAETIVLCSGGAVLSQPYAALSAFLRKARRHGHAIWGISSGVVRLAQAGLLDGQQVSAHWADTPHLEERFPGIEVTGSLFTIGDRIATCAGGSSAADLMLTHIERTGPDGLVADISARLVMDRIRDGGAVQQLPSKIRYRSTDAKVQVAISLMEAFLADPLPITEIARKVAVSQRQLERLFDAEFGKAPSKIYTDLRLERARYDVMVTTRPIIDIAMDFGFTPGNFTKLYKAVFGVTPRGERDRARRDAPDPLSR